MSIDTNLHVPEQGSAEENVTKGDYYVKHNESLPNVLLLGDSISIGYHKAVVEQLEGRANVYRPAISADEAENCTNTDYGLLNLDRWVNEREYDVIHFNWGLHDLKRLDPEKGMESDDPSFPPLNEVANYGENLEKITKFLKGTNAKLIMATTTPYPDGSKPCRLAKDAETYNKVAIDIAKINGITINDLYAFALPRLEELQQPINVHFTAEGSRQLAVLVAQSVMTALNS